jgi:putative ABC transport system permease protein
MPSLPFDYAVRNLGRSPGRLAGLLAGNALVALLVAAAGSFAEGMTTVFSSKPGSRNVILLGAGSEESVERSEVPASTPAIAAASLPGIRMVGGVACVSPEILSALIFQPSLDSNAELRAIVRGVESTAFLVHDRTQVVEGRFPIVGRNELLAGDLAEKKMGLPEGRLDPGQSLWLDGREWRVVGRMASPGSVVAAELWTSLSDLREATKRDTLSCVVLALDEAEFADVDAFAKTRIDLELSAIEESEYYAGLTRFYRPVRAMVWITAALAALAGALGGLNTLYAAFASRAREFAMLQSLGFPRRAIAASVAQESLVAASFGFVAAIALAKLLLEGAAVSFSMGVFELKINATVIASAAAASLLVGLLGGVPPAWRCLRMPIPEGLKAA